MARTRRIIVVGAGLHVMCRGNNKQIVFQCRDDKLRYYNLLLKHKDKFAVKILHYCLMNNHVHLIFWPEECSDISGFMQIVNITFMSYYRLRYGLIGHLWQGRYKSLVIETERYLLQCGKYTELNPVRAGLAPYPEQYRFSSYNVYAGGRYDPLITMNPLYEELGADLATRQRVYQEFVLESVMTKESLSRKRVLGSDQFVKRLSERVKGLSENKNVLVL